MDNNLTFDNIFKNEIVFRTFGLELAQIKEVTDKITNSFPFANFLSDCENLDAKTVLKISPLTFAIDADKAMKEFLFTFANHIYAEDDVSLELRLCELLNLRKFVLSTCESITGGRIASKIITVDGASKLFYEGLVTYNQNSKIQRLGVDETSINNFSAVSSQVCFEMAKGLLNSRNCDISISITGYAGSAVEKNKDDGLCFIGIGLYDSVDVYKYCFSGSRKEIIEKATNASLFLAIKTILNT